MAARFAQSGDLPAEISREEQHSLGSCRQISRLRSLCKTLEGESNPC